MAFDAVINGFFELGIALGQHASDGVNGKHFAYDFEVFRVFGARNIGGQNRAVHHKSVGLACFKQQKALGVVFAHDFFKVDTASALVLAQGLHRGCACGCGYVFTVQVFDAGDARVGFNGNAHFFNKGGYGKIGIFLARAVVGGGAALKVDSAVLQQRNAVLRGDRLVNRFQCGRAELFFQVVNDALGHFGVKAHIFATAQGVAQARRFAHAQIDYASGFDFCQRINALCKGGACSEQGYGSCGNQVFFHAETPLEKGWQMASRDLRNFNFQPAYFSISVLLMAAFWL